MEVKEGFYDVDDVLFDWNFEDVFFCEWMGVFCVNNVLCGCVWDVDFGNFNFLGVIFLSIGKLVVFWYFNMFYNVFMGEIFFLIGMLLRLIIFDLSMNNFMGFIFFEIGKFCLL